MENLIGGILGGILVIGMLFLLSAPIWIELISDRIGTKYGPKHCSIVWANGCGGDIDLTKPTEGKLYRDWFTFHDFGAEYRYVSRIGGVKTYGYIRNDHVEINGMCYYFSESDFERIIKKTQV